MAGPGRKSPGLLTDDATSRGVPTRRVFHGWGEAATGPPHPRERRQHESVLRLQPRTSQLPTQHRHLMAQQSRVADVIEPTRLGGRSAAAVT